MELKASARRALYEGVFRRLGLKDERLLEILSTLPRHLFVDSALAEKAYADTALPIGAGQTISQPSMVAFMTAHLQPRDNDKILEIGTGSGYQAAVLAHYTRRLYTVERHAELSRRAQTLLESLGLRNVIYKVGDGSVGWESWAPYDRIVVTAGAPVVSEKLKQQLAEGGRLLIPCGDRETQNLLLIERLEGRFRETDLGACRFVPLLGKAGWQ